MVSMITSKVQTSDTPVWHTVEGADPVEHSGSLSVVSTEDHNGGREVYLTVKFGDQSRQRLEFSLPVEHWAELADLFEETLVPAE
jgi:hypothetical protein